MNFDEAWSYLSGEGRPQGGRLGLEGLQVVLNKLGNPEKTAKKIHIAGTNGKGSTAAYSAYILASAGYRVGQYSSPAVYRFGERMRVLDGRSSKEWAYNPAHGEIPVEGIAKYLTQIKDVLDTMDLDDETYPRYYEIITLMAFLYFADTDCDVWVVETGLGGRLDATNVIPAPEVAVITAIGIDHIAELGNSFTGIATEKAGILKEGTEFLCLYDQYQGIANPEDARAVTEVFEKSSQELGINLIQMKAEEIHTINLDLTGQSFAMDGLEEVFHTQLLPDYESLNASLAIKACRGLFNDLDMEAIKFGVEHCYWPARIEKISDEPIVIIDGAHNAQGAHALRQSLDKLFPTDTNEIVVCASMRDKDQRATFTEILQNGKVKHVICTAPEDNERALTSFELANIVNDVAAKVLPEELRPMVYNIRNIEDAAKLAFGLQRENYNSIIVELGSFYIANEFREASELYINMNKKHIA